MRSSRSATTPDRRLVVFVPALESLLREASDRPALIDRLTRARSAERFDADHPGGVLATGADVAAAPLTRLRDQPGDAQGVWLRADPIGLTPDLAAVWLQADRGFESGHWQSELTSLMAEEGFRLEFHASGRGYVRLEGEPQCRFTPPKSLAGNSLEYCLPEGPSEAAWRRLLNETQILLHQLTSSSRSAPGSLWFWGAGSLPAPETVSPRIERIISEDPVLEGLAVWLELPRVPRNEGDPMRPGTLLEWPVDFAASADDNLERLDRDLRRAWRRLRFGRIGELELAGDTLRWRYRPVDAWRVWR